MPFKQYMVLSYKALPYHGFYDWGNTLHPYEITMKVRSWWGLKEKTVTVKISVTLGFSMATWFYNHKNKWLDKSPVRSY